MPIAAYTFMWILLNSYISQTFRNSDLKATITSFTLVSKVNATKFGNCILVFDKHWSVIS